MIDDIDAFEELIQGVVPQVEWIKREPAMRPHSFEVRFLDTRRVIRNQRVDAGHLMSGMEQSFAEVRANKAGRARYQTLHEDNFSLSCMSASSRVRRSSSVLQRCLLWASSSARKRMNTECSIGSLPLG